MSSSTSLFGGAPLTLPDSFRNLALTATPPLLGSRSQNTSFVTPRTIVLRESGDVTLLIGTGKTQQPVVVSSEALCLASPVWKVMFKPPWAESKAHEIPFPDDDPESMLIVLRIAHLKFQDLPAKKSLEALALHKLAVVCDKYDLVSLVRPFVDLHCWAERFFYRAPLQNAWAGWLFVAWTFGYTQSFNDLARDMAYGVSVNTLFGNVNYALNGYIIEASLPEHILESILRVRRDTLTSMLKVCYDTLDRLMNQPVCNVKNTVGSVVHEDKCRAMLVGSFIPELVKLGLYPVKKTSVDMNLSVAGFQKKLQDIKVVTYDRVDCDLLAKTIDDARKDSYNGRIQWSSQSGIKKLEEITTSQAHISCGGIANMRQAIRELVTQMPSPTLDSHRRHMEEQAKK